MDMGGLFKPPPPHPSHKTYPQQEAHKWVAGHGRVCAEPGRPTRYQVVGQPRVRFRSAPGPDNEFPMSQTPNWPQIFCDPTYRHLVPRFLNERNLFWVRVPDPKNTRVRELADQTPRRLRLLRRPRLRRGFLAIPRHECANSVTSISHRLVGICVNHWKVFTYSSLNQPVQINYWEPHLLKVAHVRQYL